MENIETNRCSETDSAPNPQDVAREYYGDGIPEFKGEKIRKMHETREKFEEEFWDVTRQENSGEKSRDAAEAIKTVLRVNYLSTQGENIIEDDEKYNRWLAHLDRKNPAAVAIDMTAMSAMERLEDGQSIDECIDYIKQRSRGDEAWENSVSRTVAMFSNQGDDFSRRKWPELHSK